MSLPPTPLSLAPLPLTLVAAVAENGVIGKGNTLPWHLTSDLKRFRALTMGKPMIMGRKNFESIGKVLPGRETIIVTRDKSFKAPEQDGLHVVHDLQAALDLGQDRAKAMQADEVILAGGGEIYAALMDQTQVMHITFVDLTPEGDVFFPKIDWSQWTEESRLTPPQDAKDEAPFTFVDYRRK